MQSERSLNSCCQLSRLYFVKLWVIEKEVTFSSLSLLQCIIKQSSGDLSWHTFVILYVNKHQGIMLTHVFVCVCTNLITVTEATMILVLLLHLHYLFSKNLKPLNSRHFYARVAYCLDHAVSFIVQYALNWLFKEFTFYTILILSCLWSYMLNNNSGL